MLSKEMFISASKEYNTFEKNVPAYYFRKSYFSPQTERVKISIAVCGLYQLYFNGKCITKGFLAPYISNTDDFIYYDEYEVMLDEGENVFGVILGNGFQNNPGGHIWDFDKSAFRSAPMFALTVENDNDLLLSSIDGFKIKDSPIRSDDYRFGESYDANYEIEGWCDKAFDDSDWTPALCVTAPKGELRMADIAPIVKQKEILPIAIFSCEDGSYIYDFGECNAGVCRLRINGTKAQKIEMRHADSLIDGDLNLAQVWFVRETWDRDKDIVHRDTYICAGNGTEEYQPVFTYHGFRYVKVSGITQQQATKDLLTFCVYHTDLHKLGGFSCSDEVAAKLYEVTMRSILANFHHFPTDCPQREKNGWTADAALSCETALLNFDPERNYREWMRNICKAQREDGALPGIVPTSGWGFEWGNGPAWDCVLARLPYYTYIYRGKSDMIRDSVQAYLSYLHYLRSRTDENGLLCIGLGDWCHVGGIQPKAPLILTDSIMAMSIAEKIAFMLDVIERHEEAAFARNEAQHYKKSIRENLIDYDTMIAQGSCQSSQAMCLYYGIFCETEKKAAFEKLLEMIHAMDDHIDVGVLGGRVIFHVLSEFRYSDLAYYMITRDDYPSYGNWLKRGATTLWEDFFPDKASSMNHHFWGDICAWFVKRIVGLQLNPDKHNINTLKIKPAFIRKLDHASAYHDLPSGRISVSWKREDQHILLEVSIPKNVDAAAELDSAYCFEDGTQYKSVSSGTYKIITNNI